MGDYTELQREPEPWRPEKLENVNPNLYQKIDERNITADEEDENVVDEFDAREIFGKSSL